MMQKSHTHPLSVKLINFLHALAKSIALIALEADQTVCQYVIIRLLLLMLLLPFLL